jgi:hypothetical protein
VVKMDFKHPDAWAKGRRKKETGRSEGRMMLNKLVDPVAANEFLQWEVDLNAFIGRQASIVTVNGGCSPGVIVEVEKPTPNRVVVDWYALFQASRFNVRIADTAITRWVYGRDLIGLEQAPGHPCKPAPKGQVK